MARKTSKRSEAELDEDNPFRLEVEIAKPATYDGEKVWKSGEWFAHAQGPRHLRALVLMDPKNTGFPQFMDRKGRVRTVMGALRNQLSEYLLTLRREGSTKAFVLDGHLAYRDSASGFVAVDHKWPANNSLYVDDCYGMEVFKAGEGTKPLSFRRKQVGNHVRGIDSPTLPLIRATKFYRVESRKQFEQMRIDAASVRGWGLTLRRDAPYRAGRTGDLLYVPPIDGGEDE